MTYGYCAYHEIECDYKGSCIDCQHNTVEDTDWFKQDEEQADSKVNEVLDKIRAEIVDLGQRTMNDNRASGIWACRDIIDKYKTERNK